MRSRYPLFTSDINIASKTYIRKNSIIKIYENIEDGWFIYSHGSSDSLKNRIKSVIEEIKAEFFLIIDP